MRITFLLVRRVPDRPSPLLEQVARRLRSHGHHVTGFIVEEVLTSADPHPDDTLYLLKSHTESALSVASALEARGRRVFNPLQACTTAQDKVLANQRLAAAGVAVPDTWTTATPSTALELLRQSPLVLKPVRGHRGVGVHVVRTPAELAALPTVVPVVVQRYVEGPGQDLKVYVVGEHVWAVRKPFDEASFTRPGVPVAVTPEVRALAQRVADASGLGLFGIDVLESADGPVVVDLNYFPGYKGCEGVAGPMADYLHGIATGERTPPALPPLHTLPLAGSAAPVGA